MLNHFIIQKEDPITPYMNCILCNPFNPICIIRCVDAVLARIGIVFDHDAV